MKRLSPIIICLMMAIFADAKTLKVYTTTGNVSKKSGNSWVSLSKSADISDSETIRINPLSSLKVIDSSNRQIYTFTSQGVFTLGELLKRSAKENASLSGRINAEVQKQIASSSNKSHNTYGASKRALWDDEEIEGLYSALVKAIGEGVNIGALQAFKRETEAGSIYLELANNGSEELYVNVFIGGENTPWTPIYEFDNEDSSLLIPSGEVVSMNHVELVPLPGDKIIVVGFESPFDGSEIKEMFTDNLEVVAEPLDGISIYFVK